MKTFYKDIKMHPYFLLEDQLLKSNIKIIIIVTVFVIVKYCHDTLIKVNTFVHCHKILMICHEHLYYYYKKKKKEDFFKA